MANEIDLGSLQKQLEKIKTKAIRSREAKYRAKTALWRAEHVHKKDVAEYEKARIALDDATHALLE